MLALRIEGKSCPIASPTTIPIAFASDTLRYPQRQRSGIDIEFRLLRTPDAAELFAAEGDLHAIERFNANHHTATLVADGVEMLEGTLYAIDFAMDLSDNAPYRVCLRSGGAEWARWAARQRLADVDIDWSMRLTLSQIADSWSLTSPVRMLPFVASDHPSPELSPYSAEQIMLIDDYYPFIALRRVVEHIFTSAGYRIESRFLESSLFDELMISGAYAEVDSAAQRAKMAFCSGRSSRVTAVANELGRVVASVGVLQHSVGNVVDCTDPTQVDDEGRTMSDLFNTGDTFGIDDAGYARFKAQSSATVGFLLHLHYLTDCRIESRYRMRGFDRIEMLPIGDVEMELPNRHTDCRDMLVGNMAYNLCIFDFAEGDAYHLTISDAESSTIVLEQQIFTRFTPIVVPAGGASYFVTLMPLSTAADTPSDWAMYEGFVSEVESREVEATVRIAPQEFAKGETRRFNEIWFSGAEPDMSLTLLSDCRLTPYFGSKFGFGSTIDYGDISHGAVWLIDIYESLCQMFNLVTYTDKSNRTVYIEPMESFYAAEEVVDWSDRIDHSKPIRISDAATGRAERLKFCYAGADKAVAEHNNETGEEFGAWEVAIPLYGTTDSTELCRNKLFSPTLSRANVISTAPTARIMTMDAPEGGASSERASVTPRIVRYHGLRPLPMGEYWTGPGERYYYPLAAFDFEGDPLNAGFTLGYAPTEDDEGLSQYYRSEVARRSAGRYLTLSLRLRASDIASLFKAEAPMPSIRSTYRFNINGESIDCRLVAIESFDVSSPSTECTFITLCDQ